jgi:hypothetical protein
MNNPDYEMHAIEFFKRYKNSLNNYKRYNFEYDSLQYVSNQSDIRNKDRVDGDVLVSILEKLGYLKFDYKENHFRHHTITDKGIDFLKSIN